VSSERKGMAREGIQPVIRSRKRVFRRSARIIRSRVMESVGSVNELRVAGLNDLNFSAITNPISRKSGGMIGAK